MASSLWGYQSPPLSPSFSTSTPLPATPLRGLGLSDCLPLLETNDASVKLPPPLGSPTRRGWLSNQAGQDNRRLSTGQNVPTTNYAAINHISAITSSTSCDLVPAVATAATKYPITASFLDYPSSYGLDPFSPRQYRGTSSMEYQPTSSYMATSSAMEDLRYPWYDLEQQDDYSIPIVSSSYSTPVRVESSAVSRAIFPGNQHEPPSRAGNLKSDPRVEEYQGFGAGTDILPRQNRTKDHRAFSWPGNRPNLEQSQEIDDCISNKSSETSNGASRRFSHSRKNTSRVARDRNYGTTMASTRVTCSYGNGCNQTFNRKTDLDRHINTVHLRMRDKVCPFCGYGFGRRDILNRHLKGNGCPSRPKCESAENNTIEQAKIGPFSTERPG